MTAATIAPPAPPATRAWDPLAVRFTSSEDYALTIIDERAGLRSERHGAQSLPHPRAWAHSVVRATLEVLTGYRPVTHLQRWVSPEVYSALARRAALALRVGEPGGRQRPTVRSIRVSSVARGRVDVIGTISDGDRTRAVALEMVVRRLRWVVTEIVVG